MSSSISVITKPNFKNLENEIYLIPAIGCGKNDVAVNSDCNEKEINVIYVKTLKPKELTLDVFETIDFENEYKIVVDLAYDVRKTIVEIKNGLIIITVPSNKNRISSIEIK